MDINKDTPLNLVSLGPYWTYVDAWIVRNLLAENGVPAEVNGEYYVTVDWAHANAAGGVYVAVPQDHYDRAIEIVDSPPELSPEFLKQSTATDASIDEFVSGINDDNPTGVQCPVCQSSNAGRETFERRLVFLLWMLITVPVPIRSGAVICFDCGTRTGPPPAYGQKQFRWRGLLAIAGLMGIYAAGINFFASGVARWLYVWFATDSVNEFVSEAFR